MKALEKDRARRYETPSGLARDIQRHLADEPVEACPPSAAYRFRKFATRNKVAFTTASLVAVTLLLGIVLSARQAIRATQAEGLAEERLQSETIALGAADNAREQAISERDVARRRLFVSRLAEARASRWSRRVGQRFESLTALAEAARLLPAVDLGPEAAMELRNEAIAAMTLTDLRVSGEWWDLPADTSRSPVFDSQLQRYACSDNERNIRVYEAGSNELVRLPPVSPGWSPWTVQFSPDDQFIAVVYRLNENRLLRVWDWNRAEAILEVPDVREGPGFSPDSRQLAIGHKDGSIRVFDLASRAQLRRFSPGVPPGIVRFHPKEPKLAVAGARVAHVLNLDTGDVIARLPPTSASSIAALAWHPQGRHLATAADNRISIWDIESVAEKPRLVLEGHQSLVTRLAFNQRGDVLASNGYDAVLRLWDPWTGQPLVSMPGGGVPPQFSSDDRLIAHQVGPRVCRLELARPLECSLFGGEALPAGVGSGMAFTADSRVLAGAARDAVRLWDVTTGAPIAKLPIQAVDSVLFEPGMEYLVTSSFAGLYQWPISRRDDGGWEIGSRQALSTPMGVNSAPAAISRDGRTLAARTRNGEGVVIHRDQSDQKVSFKPHPHLWSLALSPDGQWLATGPWNAHLVRIWDARTGEHKLDLPLEAQRVSVVFSPDAQWLVTGTSREFRFWRVGTWEPGLEIRRDTVSDLPGYAAFAPDGSLLAITHSLRAVKLIDLESSREVATLETPNCEMVAGVCFSPDGTLLAVGDERHSVHVWDLRRIRTQLAAMSLDWSTPSYEPGAEAVPATSVAVHVVSDPTPPAKNPTTDEAIASYTRIIEFTGEQPTDPARTAELAETWNALGLRQKTIGRPAEASQSFDQSLALWQSLIEQHPSEPRYLRGLASVYASIGGLHSELQDHEAAVRFAQMALAVSEQLVQENPGDVEAQADLMRATGNVGNRLGDARQWDASLAQHEKKLELLQELIKQHGMKKAFELQLGETHNSIGDTHRNRRQPDWGDQAVAAYLKAQAIQERMAQEHPTDKRLQSGLANTLSNLGSTYWHTKKYHAALESLDQTIVLQDRLVRRNPSNLYDLASLGTTHCNRGRVLAALGRSDEAIAAFQSGISHYERLVQLTPDVERYRRELAGFSGELTGLQKRRETSGNQKP